MHDLITTILFLEASDDRSERPPPPQFLHDVSSQVVFAPHPMLGMFAGRHAVSRGPLPRTQDTRSYHSCAALGDSTRRSAYRQAIAERLVPCARPRLTFSRSADGNDVTVVWCAYRFIVLTSIALGA